jgi:hypothetical protein
MRSNKAGRQTACTCTTRALPSSFGEIKSPFLNFCPVLRISAPRVHAAANTKRLLAFAENESYLPVFVLMAYGWMFIRAAFMAHV